MKDDETTPEASVHKACPRCGRKFDLVRSFLNPDNGRTLKMYQCRCGERTWSE